MTWRQPYVTFSRVYLQDLSDIVDIALWVEQMYKISITHTNLYLAFLFPEKQEIYDHTTLLLLLRPLDLWRWRHYICLKYWELITQWRDIITQKNTVLIFVSCSQKYYCSRSLKCIMQIFSFVDTWRLQKICHNFINKCNTETKVLR